MIQTPFKAIIFDLDGTLIDTIDDLCDTVNKLLKDHQLQEHPRQAYLTMVGDGIRMLIKRALPENISSDEKNIDDWMILFKQAYHQNWNKKTRPYSGINDMLHQLCEKNIKKGVLSNKPQEFTNLCVDHFFPGYPFDAVFGARPGKPVKPDPASAIEIANNFNIDPSEILYVGDTSIDMKTANNAGMFPLGVEWGFRSRQELIDAGAKIIIQHPSELLLVI